MALDDAAHGLPVAGVQPAASGLSVMSSRHNVLVVGSAWISRIVSAAISLAIIRLLADELGAEQTAVFVLLTGLTGWYALADFGVGTSTQNFISERRAAGLPYADLVHVAVQSVLVMLMAALAWLFCFGPWLASVVLGTFALDQHHKTQLFMLATGLFVVMNVGSIGYKIWYSEMRGYWANIAPTVGACIGIVLAVIVLNVELIDDKLEASIVAFVFPSALIAIGSIFYRAKWRSTMTRLPGRSVAGQVLGRAVRFWFLSLMQAAIVNADYFFIALYATPEELIVYGIASRIFGFAAFFYTSLYTALWPQFTELLTKGEWGRVARRLTGAFAFSAVLIVCFSVVFLVFKDGIIGVMVPKESITIPSTLILALACYHIVIAWVHGCGIPLQSMSDVRPFFVWMPVQAVLNIGLQFLLVPVFGVVGVVMAMTLSFILTMAWALPYRVRWQMRTALTKGKASEP